MQVIKVTIVTSCTSLFMPAISKSGNNPIVLRTGSVKMVLDVVCGCKIRKYHKHKDPDWKSNFLYEQGKNPRSLYGLCKEYL